MPGVPDLDLVVADPQGDGLRRGPLDDDGVESGVLQLGAPEAPYLGRSEGARERRSGSDGVSRGPGDGQSRQHARREDQPVLGAQGIATRGEFSEQHIGDDVPTTEIAAHGDVAGLFDVDGAGRQVDAQDLVME